MAENRLIDANAVRNALYDADAITMQGVAIINQFPTVDAVKVVRCKHCEHCDWYTKTYELTGLSETKYWCSANKGPAVEVRAEHFCSYGVAKN
jgi:hypothetical protein